MADFQGGPVSRPSATEEDIPEKRRKIENSENGIGVSAGTSNSVQPWLNFNDPNASRDGENAAGPSSGHHQVSRDHYQQQTRPPMDAPCPPTSVAAANNLSNNDDDDDDDDHHATEMDWNNSSMCHSWLYNYMVSGADPRLLLQHIQPGLASDADPRELWKRILSAIQPERRKKLEGVNTLKDVVALIRKSKKILLLTGAGVSVSCGIPDFRSRDGLYARLAVEYPELSEPQSMFDINFFRENPMPFFKFAKEIYPGQYQPSRCHRFMAQLDRSGRLLRNYTQNIDTLESLAGVRNVIHCHGSFRTASCTSCGYQVLGDSIKEQIFKQEIPQCPRCASLKQQTVKNKTNNNSGTTTTDDDDDDDVSACVMKPDIVFFGENLPESFHRQMSEDKDQVDLLIVIGSSLAVKPVANIPCSIPHNVPQILINRERLKNFTWDVELLGDCDVIVSELARRLEADHFATVVDQDAAPLKELDDLQMLMQDEEDGEGEENGEKKEENEEERKEEQAEAGGEQKDDEKSEGSEAVSKEEEGAVDSKEDESCCSTAGCSGKPGKEAAGARWQDSVSRRLPPNTFFYNGQSRYVFPGAEIYLHELFQLGDDDDDDDAELSSCSSSSDEEEENNQANDTTNNNDDGGDNQATDSNQQVATTTSADGDKQAEEEQREKQQTKEKDEELTDGPVARE